MQEVVFSPDSRTLYSDSTDAAVRVWDSAIGRMKRIFRGYDRGVTGLAYAAAGHQLLAVSADGRARLVHADTGELVETYPPPNASSSTAWLQTAAVSGDSRWMAWADTEGRYRLLRVPH